MRNRDVMEMIKENVRLLMEKEAHMNSLITIRCLI